MRNMKRKIPVFRVSLSDGVTYEQVSSHPEIRKVVIEETIFAIKEGVKNKKKSIPLFQIAGTTTYLELEKEKWQPTLEKILDQYIEDENYDKCIEIRDLIKQI
jgi:hypothetical protein